MNTCISVVGLGKLGACMAATMASKGAHVMGVDVNASTVDALNEGRAPVVEPHLQAMITAHRPSLRATTSFDEAVAASSMSFIIVPTPSDQNGSFSLRYAEQAARAIGRALRDKSDYHLVVLTSTVLPGSTEYGILPALEDASGKKCGRDFGLCYNPEFIALGNVIQGLLNPDFILIGESDERAGGMLAQWYGTYCDNQPPVARMNFVNAELTKISVNTFVTMKITFANMLAAICEELPGADVDTVTDALGRDLRIGRRYLTGGLGYGGPCFPRDNQALASVAQTVGVPGALAEATDAMNRKLFSRQMDRVCALMHPGMRLGILGLSYKPNTNVIEESQGFALAQVLSDNGNDVAVYDPYALGNARSVLQDKVRYMPSARECVQHADLVVITTPADEFRALQASDFPQRREKIIVLDCWRILAETLRHTPWVEYLALGVGHDHAHIARALAHAAL